MESALNLFYFAMAFYGWWVWYWGHSGDEELPVSAWPYRVHATAIAAIVVASMLSGYLLSRYSDAVYPYIDSMTTWGAIWATFLVARKVLENWWYWLVIDSASIVIYWSRDLHLTALLFAVYVVMIPFGLVERGSVRQAGAGVSHGASRTRSSPGSRARAAAFRELPGGLTNRTLQVEKDGQRAVLKIDPLPRKPPFNSRQDEARIQQRAAALGRANGALYAGDTVLLAEWADGEVWTRAHFDDDANLVRLGRALREIHGLPLRRKTFDLQAAARARKYAAQLDGSELDHAKPHLEAIESAPGPVNLCCCHNDLVAENILSTPDIRFLDWEYACDNDPLFDLAVVVAHHDLSAGQADVLLDARFDGKGGPLRERFRNPDAPL